MKQTSEIRKKRNIIPFIIIVIFTISILGIIFNHFNTQRIMRDGLRTTAIVTNVESRNIIVDVGVNRSEQRTRHYTTFEYHVDGQTIAVVRTTETPGSNAAPRLRVGDVVEIYYDAQNPRNFVFADSSGNFSIVGIIFIGVLSFVIFKIIRSLNRTKNRGNENPLQEASNG